MIKQLCILVAADNLDAAKAMALKLPYFTKAEALFRVGLSATGAAPATHYLCASNYTDRLYNDVVALKNDDGTDYTELYVGNPKDFIESKNLKVVAK